MALDALLVVHKDAFVAKRLGVSLSTVHAQLAAARRKMSSTSRIEVCLMWSEFRRQQAAAVAPPPAPKLEERHVVARLVDLAKQHGVGARAVEWRGRRDAPDWVLMFPSTWTGTAVAPGAAVWVECKATGEKPRNTQAREHNYMREHGQRVEVVDSYAGVEALFK